MTLKNTKQKYKKLKDIALVLTISGAIFAGTSIVGGMCSTYGEGTNNRQLINNLSYLKDTEAYSEYMDSAYYEYKNGEINLYQFNKKTDFSTAEKFAGWAKTLNNESVDRIITNYEKEKQRINEDRIGNLSMFGIGSMGILTGYLLNKQANKRKRKCGISPTLETSDAFDLEKIDCEKEF